MINLNAGGYSRALMWLGYFEGLIHTLGVELSKENLTYIRDTCVSLASAFGDDLPASVAAARTIERELNASVKYVRLRILIDQFKATLPAEMEGRTMLVLPRGQAALQPDIVLSPAPSRSAAGGRPPKSWWDDLWAEIGKQLYEGDLKPDRQTDIEKAMHDWITKNGHSAGETQVRERARKLFNTLTK
jgi:hypothetical protein